MTAQGDEPVSPTGLPHLADHRHADVTGGWLRAATFGAMDGLVSNTALIAGVAATADAHTVVISGVAGLLAGGQQLAAQTSTPDDWTPPRMADGRPDLQGVWLSNTATPLQRPRAFAGRARLTDDEVARLRRLAAAADSHEADAARLKRELEAAHAAVSALKVTFHRHIGGVG